MKLIHYSPREIEFQNNYLYDQNEVKFHSKPNGLWVSVEGEDDWKNWCLDEKFCLERLRFSYEIVLKNNANILYLTTPKEIYEFSEKYSWRSRPRISGGFDPKEDTHELNWFEIKNKYQGIIISPYQWECRLALESSWYYGWDCSSGCIWDMNCIDFMEFIGEDLLMPTEPEKRPCILDIIKESLVGAVNFLVEEDHEPHEYEYSIQSIYASVEYLKKKRSKLKKEEK